MKKCYTCTKDKAESEFNKNSIRKDGLNSICRDCSKARSKRYYKENPVKHKAETSKNRERYRRKYQVYLLEYLSNNPCIECGESDIRCLDFDHLKDKEIVISKAMYWSIDRLKLEIAKCQVLCANCHRKKSHKESNSYKHKHYMGS